MMCVCGRRLFHVYIPDRSADVVWPVVWVSGGRDSPRGGRSPLGSVLTVDGCSVTYGDAGRLDPNSVMTMLPAPTAGLMLDTTGVTARVKAYAHAPAPRHTKNTHN
eukprot:1182448-Prorocentrum_minimum.AAC.16